MNCDICGAVIHDQYVIYGDSTPIRSILTHEDPDLDNDHKPRRSTR